MSKSKRKILMPPETNTQPPIAPTPQPPTPNPTPQAPQPDLLGKKTRNAGRSVILFGGFMLLISLIVILGISNAEPDTKASVITYFAVSLLASIGWIIQGLKIKKSTDAVTAVKALDVALYVAVAVVIVSIGITIFKPTGGGGLGPLMTVVLIVYLLIARSGLKKLNH